jgi:CheY-like chemotaxis protein
MMPGMSGETFRAHQLADPALATIPVVLLSGARGVDEAARRLGVESLPKPVELEQLLGTIGHYCTAPRRR